MTLPLTGLFVNLESPAQSPTAVPLEGVAIHARLAGTAAEVSVTQRYRNTEDRPIEAVYVFPLPSDAAVCGFEAEVDGRRIEGRVEERERAFEIYDDALAAGDGAFLLDQERPNIFTASVGNLRPGSTVAVRIRYVLVCALDGEAVRFQLPTTVSPRYVPATATREVGEPDAARIDPERRLSVPYGLTLTVDVEGARPPRRIESPSHPIRTTLEPGVARIELGQEVVALDRDFVLLVEPAEARTPTARASRDAAGTRYVQVQFIPTFGATEASGQEVVFLLDCSGSMQGDSIAQARRALELCVRALGERDTFDIVRFGSTSNHLFGQARTLDAACLGAAVAHIATTHANLGGTELLAPLRAILERPIDPARPRQILLLTDGQVGNEAEVFELAKAHQGRARVFTFGIGAGVSEHLVRELARVSGAEVELITPGERIEPKVLRQFGRLRTPVLTDIRVDWGGLEVEQAPRAVPPVFQGELLTVFGRVRAGAPAAGHKVSLRAGPHVWEVPVDLESAALDGPIPKAWGRAAIRDLERDEGRHGSSQQRPEREAAKRKKLVDLGRELGLVSSLTSYVAVEVRSLADKTAAPAELRKVPVALTHGWGGVGTAAGVPKPVAAGMPMRPSPSVAPGSPAPMRRHRAPDQALPTALYAADDQSLPARRPAPMPAPAAAPPSAPADAAPSPGFLTRAASAISGAFGGGKTKKSAEAVPESTARRESGAASIESALASIGGRDRGARASDDALYDVLLTQGADGSFPLSAALVDWLGRERTALDEAVRAHGEARAATALVLALLEARAADRRGEWAAAAAKARSFLERTGGALDLRALARP